MHESVFLSRAKAAGMKIIYTSPAEYRHSPVFTLHAYQVFSRSIMQRLCVFLSKRDYFYIRQTVKVLRCGRLRGLDNACKANPRLVLKSQRDHYRCYYTYVFISMRRRKAYAVHKDGVAYLSWTTATKERCLKFLYRIGFFEDALMKGPTPAYASVKYQELIGTLLKPHLQTLNDASLKVAAVVSTMEKPPDEWAWMVPKVYTEASDVIMEELKRRKCDTADNNTYNHRKECCA